MMHRWSHRRKTHSWCNPMVHISLARQLPPLSPARSFSFTRKQMLPMRSIFLQFALNTRNLETNLPTIIHIHFIFFYICSSLYFLSIYLSFFQIFHNFLKHVNLKKRMKNQYLKVARDVVASKAVDSHDF